jgi:hypothetical protein
MHENSFGYQLIEHLYHSLNLNLDVNSVSEFKINKGSISSLILF